jgi:phosphate transport system protein
MESQSLGPHYSKQFDEEIEHARTQVLEMGGVVEEQLRLALRALVKGDSELGDQVAENDYRINEFEVSIDEECSSLIARRQPTASDLRQIMMIIKTITDLERIGDEAEKIGLLASRLAVQERPASRYREIRHLGDQVGDMVSRALDAFARGDAMAAIEISHEDKRVDEEYESVMRQGITHMMEDPRSIRRVIDTLWVAKSLERIGDHAKNIGEYVVYMVHGKDIRHIGRAGKRSFEEALLQEAERERQTL